ncbi:MAG TPA: ABC transporter permease [Candidatus Limnocylindrales bacterium]|nr:ABC transporter permease [Candidatus Limnocylindrales bacterium]
MSQTANAVRAEFRARPPGPFDTIATTVREVTLRRRLIAYLVRADLKKRGANTVLGNIWWILDPLLTMLVYVILVTIIVRSTREAYPLFIFAAILPWKWFSSTLNDAVTSIIGREKIIKQVKFPKIVLPLASVGGGLISFLFGLIPLSALLILFYSTHISPWLLLIPVIAAVQVVFTMGVSILASGLTVYFRDLGNVTGHALRIWFYLSPALYGTEQIESLATNHKELFTLYELNPFAGLFESYRDVIYYGQAPEWNLLVIVLAESIALLVAAVLVFRRLESSFAKVL